MVDLTNFPDKEGGQGPLENQVSIKSFQINFKYLREKSIVLPFA